MKTPPRSSRLQLLGVAGAVALLCSANASATLVNGIVDTWNVDVNSIFDTASIVDSNGASPGGVTILNNRSLRWGDDIGSGRSGLDITNSPSNANVATNGPSVANVSITHHNNPITGTTLRSLNILSTLTLTPFAPPSAALPPTTITFGVDYLETSNGDNPCADGGANGVGVNSAGCADIYVTNQNSLNFPFFYDLDGGGPLQNQQYFISFFEATAGLNPLPAAACGAVGVAAPCLGFRTPEGQDTTVQFAALITTRQVTVPEPGSLALFALALGALSFYTRKPT